MSLYFWYTIILLYMLAYHIFMTSPLWLAVGRQSLSGGLFTNFYMCFWLHGCCCYWEGWLLVNRFNHTSWVTAVTRTDRPKSVRNSFVIKVFGGVFMLSRCFLNCSVGVGFFCHRTESDLFLFLLLNMRRCTLWSISMHILLRMNAMLDFICTSCGKLCGTEN